MSSGGARGEHVSPLDLVRTSLSSPGMCGQRHIHACAQTSVFLTFYNPHATRGNPGYINVSPGQCFHYPARNPVYYEDKHDSNYKLFCDGETCVQSDLQLSKHLVPNIHRWCDFFGMLVCVRSSMRENILSAKLA